VKLKNINPLGDVRPAALGMQLVKAGDIVEVSDEVAALLVIQTENWEPVKPSKAEKEAADLAISDHLADLEAVTRSAGIHLDVPPESAAEQAPEAEPATDTDGDPQ
jgi:hypothetical protein